MIVSSSLVSTTGDFINAEGQNLLNRRFVKGSNARGNRDFPIAYILDENLRAELFLLAIILQGKLFNVIKYLDDFFVTAMANGGAGTLSPKISGGAYADRDRCRARSFVSNCTSNQEPRVRNDAGNYTGLSR